MIKNNLLPHGNAKALGFMGTETLGSTGQAGELWSDFCRYTRETSLRHGVSIIFSHWDRKRLLVQAVSTLKNLRQIQEKMLRIKCAVIRGNKIDLRFRQEAKAFKWKGHELFLWIERHQAKQDRRISLHFLRWLCRIANPVNTQTDTLTFQVLIRWSRTANVFPCISAVEWKCAKFRPEVWNVCC